MDSAVMGWIRQAELTGQEQYNAFVEEEFVGQSKKLSRNINYHS